jgi:hypothetical protein
VILAIGGFRVATVSPPQKQVATAYGNKIWHGWKNCRGEI